METFIESEHTHFSIDMRIVKEAFPSAGVGLSLQEMDALVTKLVSTPRSEMGNQEIDFGQTTIEQVGEICKKYNVNYDLNPYDGSITCSKLNSGGREENDAN